MDIEMIERVATAMYEDYRANFAIVVMPSECTYDKSAFKSYAKAAIAAMREPTKHMYEYLSGHGPVWREQTSYGVWTTYIDAIIKE